MKGLCEQDQVFVFDTYHVFLYAYDFDSLESKVDPKDSSAPPQTKPDHE